MQGRWGNVSCVAKVRRGYSYLVLLEAVLKDVLNDQAAGLTKSNLVPHTMKSIIDVLHDLRRRLSPSELKQLLPDMAGIAVDDGLRNTAKKLMNHDGLVVLWNRVKSLLDDVATESIHRDIQGVSTNSLGDLDDLLGSSMLEASLNQEVTKAIDHQWICLSNNCLDNLILLVGCTNLELLLKEY